jgi:hypothetical protein
MGQTKPETDTRPDIDPSRMYESPKALAADARLTLEERLDLLRRWDFDLREQLVASGEGMPAGAADADGHAGDDADDLGEIAEAIAALTSENEKQSTTGTPTQHGTFPTTPDEGDADPDEHERAHAPLDSLALGPMPASERKRSGLRLGSPLLIVLLALLVLAAGFAAAWVEAPAPFVILGGILLLALFAAFAHHRRRAR